MERFERIGMKIHVPAGRRPIIRERPARMGRLAMGHRTCPVRRMLTVTENLPMKNLILTALVISLGLLAVGCANDKKAMPKNDSVTELNTAPVPPRDGGY